jgi:hypothetical protein
VETKFVILGCNNLVITTCGEFDHGVTLTSQYAHQYMCVQIGAWACRMGGFAAPKDV